MSLDTGGRRLTLVAPPGAFRLFLASAVIIGHISRIDIGRLAVLLFFYLSGYWTSRIWAEKFQSRALGHFYAARYLRIAPLFLLVTLGAAWLRHAPLHLVNFTLLGLASTDSDPTGVSWSLDIELQFYLALPLVAAALSKRWRALAWALIGLLAVAGWYLETRFHIHTVAKYLPVFALGVMTYVARWTPSERAANLSLAAFVAMTALTAMTPFMFKVAKPFDEDIWCFIWLLPLLPYAMRSLTVRSSRLDRHLGNLSFPIYLAHYPVIAIANEMFGVSMAVKMASVAAAIAVAFVLYWLVDRPIDRLRLRLTESTLAQARVTAH